MVSRADSDTNSPVKMRPLKWQKAFLAALAETGIVLHAAAAAGIQRNTAYNRRLNDPDFAAAWDEAIEDAADRLEQEARRRAYEGTDEPVFYRGEQCGAIRRYSDRLLEFLLKGMRPHKFRENHSLEHSGNLNHEVIVKKLAPGISMDDI